MALAAAVTVAAVVRLGLHARREEIEIMRLVGSPIAFIRGPFVAEGLLQGGVGAAGRRGASVGRIRGRVSAWWGGALPPLLDGAALRVPARSAQLALLVAGGMAWGRPGDLPASRHADDASTPTLTDLAGGQLD